MSSMHMPMLGSSKSVADKDNPRKINVGKLSVKFTTYEGSEIDYTYTGSKDDKLLNRTDFQRALKEATDIGFIRESKTRYISVKDIQYIDVEYLEYYIDKE